MGIATLQKPATRKEVGLYFVQGTANNGMPGSPTLEFHLTVFAPTGAITGIVKIGRAHV